MGGGMGMMSVPPTSLPFAELKAGQTRNLPPAGQPLPA